MVSSVSLAQYQTVMTPSRGFALRVCILGFALLSFGMAPSSGVCADDLRTKLAEAKSYEGQGQFEEAIKVYESILKESPSSNESRLGLGRSLANFGRCEEAAKVLQPIVQNRGETETLVGVCYFRTHDYKAAITRLEPAVHLAPASKEARLYLGRSYAAAGRPEKAVLTLKSWLERNGNDVDVLYWIGKFYEDLGTRAFQKMAETYPNSYMVYQLQGEQEFDKKDYKKAMAAFDKALAIAPGAPGLHYWRGYVYWRQRSLYKAQEDFETELRSNPYHAQANYLLGDIFVSLRDPDKALPFLERAVALNPGIWDAHRSLGRALVMKNRLQEAVQQFQIVANNNPHDDSIHGLLSNAYRRLGDLEKAKEEEKLFEKLNAARRDRVPKPSVENPPVAAAPE